MSKFSRRHFLKLGAGACAGATMSSLIGCGSGDDDDDNDDDDINNNEPPDLSDDDDDDSTPTERSNVHALLFDELSELFDQTRLAMTTLRITKNSLTGSTVFIKPNFVSLGLGNRGFLGASGECTKAELAAAVAEMCLEAGAAKVTIGEGAQGESWDWSIVYFLNDNNFHGATNLAAAVDYLNTKYGAGKCELICLNQTDQWARIPSCATDEVVADGLMVSKHWYEADHVISLPVIKSHLWAVFTGSMKNYVGSVPVHDPMGAGFVRQKLHAVYAHATMAGYADIGITGAFLDAHRYRLGEGRQDFSIVDCSIGVEGSGPHVEPVNPGITIDIKSRTPANKYFLLAGDDYVANDYVMSKVMNFGPVLQLKMAEHLGLGRIDKGVRLKGASLSDIFIGDWLPPFHMKEDFFIMLDNLFNIFGKKETRERIYLEALRLYTAA